MFLENRDCGISLFISVPFPEALCGALPVGMEIWRIYQKHILGREYVRAKAPRCKNDGHIVQVAVSRAESSICEEVHFIPWYFSPILVIVSKTRLDKV